MENEPEIARIMRKIEYLRKTFEQCEAQNNAKITELEFQVAELRRKLAFGRGIVYGVFAIFGAIGWLLVDGIKAVIAHIGHIK